jgi:hypothetical protein
MFELLLGLLLADASPTASASPLPTVMLAGDTTDGKHVTYPSDARGKPLVLVVGFTQASGKATERWTEALQTDIGSRAAIVGVAVLDAVPGFARGFVQHAIDKQIGPPKPGDAGFLTTFEGGSLRQAAPSGDKDVPVLYVFRSDGTLILVERESYASDAASAFEKSVP